MCSLNDFVVFHFFNNTLKNTLFFGIYSEQNIVTWRYFTENRTLMIFTVYFHNFTGAIQKKITSLVMNLKIFSFQVLLSKYALSNSHYHFLPSYSKGFFRNSLPRVKITNWTNDNYIVSLTAVVHSNVRLFNDIQAKLLWCLQK